MSTVCPECGHIIDKNETDEEIVYLINLLRKFISGEIYESDIELPQKEYRKYKKYYNKNVDYNGSVFCNYNRERIMAEATLYKANPEIQSLLKKIDNPMYKALGWLKNYIVIIIIVLFVCYMFFIK